MRSQMTAIAVALAVAPAACTVQEAATNEPASPSDGVEAPTYYTNPGDSRAASFVDDEGRVVTAFGPKTATGELVRIAHVTIESPDGDAAKRLDYDFGEDGNVARGRLGSGETMLFTWPSAGRVIITYRSADGSQEARFPYDLGAPSDVAPSSQRLSSLRHAATNEASMTGELQVTCGDGALVSQANVSGELLTSPQTGTDVRSPIAFTETGLSGLFEYPLPVGRAPNPGEGFHRTRFQRAVDAICGLNTLQGLLAAGSAEAACLALSAIPAIGAVGTATCTVIVLGTGIFCGVRSATNKVGKVVDLFSTEYFVTVNASHAKLGSKELRYQVRSGDVVPRQTIALSGAAAISSLQPDVADPAEGQSYTIEAKADCAGEGYTLGITIRGSDGYSNSAEVALGKTVHEAKLFVPGARKGVVDTFTATLRGPTADTKTSSVTF